MLARVLRVPFAAVREVYSSGAANADVIYDRAAALHLHYFDFRQAVPMQSGDSHSTLILVHLQRTPEDVLREYVRLRFEDPASASLP